MPLFFHRLYDEPLAHASYLVGCAETRQAIAIDPHRDIGRYLEVANRERARIVAVTETHIHADFVSGSRELARATGASLFLSGAGGPDWQYAYAAAAGAVLLENESRIDFGSLRLRAMHTPGHTPEHLSLLLGDADVPEAIGIFTGDFVFVGDVGRPDLLETAAGVVGSMEASARQLHRSLTVFRTLPDYLQLWPGHGAGSACGRSLSAMPQSTVGFEKRFNWAFAIENEDEFVRAVLSGQPEPPRYFARMKRVNRAGPAILGELAPPPRVDASELGALLERRAAVIDTRSAAEFARRHVVGTVSIPDNRSFSTRAGSLLDFDAPVYVIADADVAARVARDLAMIGLDRLAGYFAPAVIDDPAMRSRMASLRTTSPRELSRMIQSGAVQVIDVRGRAEWDEAHIPGVTHIPLGSIPDRVASVRRDVPVVLHCESGARSAVAASILEAAGVATVMNLEGGIAAWQREGFLVEPA